MSNAQTIVVNENINVNCNSQIVKEQRFSLVVNKDELYFKPCGECMEYRSLPFKNLFFYLSNFMGQPSISRRYKPTKTNRLRVYVCETNCVSAYANISYFLGKLT